MLVQFLLSLHWQSVLILHEQAHDPSFFCNLGGSGLTFVDYDISSFSEEQLQTILRDVESAFQGNIHVLILCDVTTTVSVLHQLSELCGTRSDSSVDWCHVSQMLVVGTSDDLPVLQGGNIQLENVALMELPAGQGHNIEPKMWTLMFHTSGRAFSDVALSHETHTNLTEVFPNVKFGYNGRHLTVLMKHNVLGYGYELVNNTEVYGYPFRILEMLADKLNFSYTVIPPREDEWGQDVNGTWTGMIGMLQRREVDLASDILSIHIDRTAVSDYVLPPVGETKQMILYKEAEHVESSHLLIFLGRFQPSVFLVFGASLIVVVTIRTSVTLVHKTYELKIRMRSKDLDENMRSQNLCPPIAFEKENITSTAFEVYGAALKQGFAIISSHDSDRILIAGWWIFTTGVSAVYCGTMMAAFAVKVEEPPFSGMADLVSREDYTIGYDSSSITENIIQNSNLSYMVAFKQRIRDLAIRDPDILSSNITKHLLRVQEGKYAFITGMEILPMMPSMCNLKMVDASIGNGAFTAFHVPKSSPFKNNVQQTMHLLHDSGILQRTFQEWIQSIPKETCRVKEFHKAVSLIKIQSVFFAVVIGLGCSAVMLVLEIVWYRMKHAKSAAIIT